MSAPQCPRCGSEYAEDLGPDGVRCHGCGKCYYPEEQGGIVGELRFEGQWDELTFGEGDE